MQTPAVVSPDLPPRDRSMSALEQARDAASSAGYLLSLEGREKASEAGESYRQFGKSAQRFGRLHQLRDRSSANSHRRPFFQAKEYPISTFALPTVADIESRKQRFATQYDAAYIGYRGWYLSSHSQHIEAQLAD